MKKEQTHTPGPWSIEDEGHLDHAGDLWIVDDRGLCVAEIESEEDAVIGPSEAEYNAHLLTAAPDLLAALRAFRQGFVDGSIQWTRPRKSEKDPYHKANTLMCAAIAKAEGRE